ncbi:MAG: DUF4831 family protein [Bacteroidetes bacterium]|nr:DUF4831 family protein [Bacteroidota bacterium]
MRYIIPVTLAAVLSFAGCAPQKVFVQPRAAVAPLSDTIRITGSSLIYALPQTVFAIDVTLQRTIEKPGPYASFARDLVGLSDVITAESEEWSVISAELVPLEEIDPSEFYVVTYTGMIQAGALIMRQQGLILDISPENMISRQMPYTTGDGDFTALRFSDLGSTQYFAVQRDTAYRLVKTDTSFFRIPYLVENRKQLTREQLADRAARALLELREGRHMILTGETNIFPQHNAAIDEINRLEKEYLSLFTGKVLNEMVTLKIYYTPETGKSSETGVLFRLSETRGVADVSDKAGVPVTINLSAAGKTKPLVMSADLQSLTSAPRDGLVYRIPEVAEVEIKTGNRTVFRTRTVVHQYGQKVLLPQNFVPGR